MYIKNCESVTENILLINPNFSCGAFGWRLKRIQTQTKQIIQ